MYDIEPVYNVTMITINGLRLFSCI